MHAMESLRLHLHLLFPVRLCIQTSSQRTRSNSWHCTRNSTRSRTTQRSTRWDSERAVAFTTGRHELRRFGRKRSLKRSRTLASCPEIY